MQDVDETLILIESSPVLVWRFPGSLAEAKGEAIDGHWPQQCLHPTAATPDVLGRVEAHSPTVNAAATLRWEGDRVVLRGPSWVVDAYCPLDPPKGTWDEYFALCTVDEFGYEDERVSCPVSLSLDGLRMVLAAPGTVRPDVWEVIGVPMASVLDVLLAHPRPKAKRLRWFGPITTQEAVAVVEAWPNLRYVDTLFSSPIDVSAFSRKIESARLYMNEGQFFASAPLPKTTAWFPVTYDRSSDARASRFGGRAWIPAGETWPLCPACGEPFTLIAQFDESKSPGPLAGSALLQVFYCRSRGGACSTSDAPGDYGDPSALVRRLRATEGSAGMAPERCILPTREITRWESQVEMDPDIVWNVEENILETPRSFRMEKRDDMVGGYPRWVQADRRPRCVECGMKHEVIIQFASHVNVDFMWGDLGRAYVTRCPQHSDQLDFGWQC